MWSCLKAINTLLVGLPVSLREGSLGNVAVKVPWPNVLAGSLSLSVSGVSLTLVLRRASPSPPTTTPIDLSSSVASLVAETFVHKDLSEAENNALRQSIHPELPMADPPEEDAFSMPGSMDPFLEGSLAASMEESGIVSDEEGVGVLTAVAERLMARFTCSARDISITLIHEGHASFHLGVSEFSYGDAVSDSNVTKVISVRGFSVSITPLEPIEPTASYSSISPAWSPGRQDSGDERQENMVQSITSLADSIMFQSAVSTVQPKPTSPSASTHQEPPSTRQILGLSDEPLAITIATRPREAVSSGVPPIATGRQRPPKFSVNATMGYLACALRPIDIGSILRALVLIKPPPSAADNHPSPRQDNKKGAPIFEGSGRIRGVVLALLLEDIRGPVCSRSQLEAEMVEFFKHPTHSLSTPHFRTKIDLIEPSFNAAGDLRVHVGEVSVFRMQGGPNPSATPMLIADPNLDSQYAINTNVPVFDIVDWTKPTSHAGPPKISAWRLRAIPGQKPKPSVGPTTAVRVEVDKGGNIDIVILPLHVFLDLKVLEDAISFGNGIGSIAPDFVSEENEYEVADSTPPTTPRYFRSVEHDMEQVETKVV